MKTCLLITFFLLGTCFVMAQSAVLSAPQKKPVKKGIIYYPNGETEPFTGLHFGSDRVEFQDENSVQRTVELQNIEAISVISQRYGVGKGAIGGATVGFAGGMLTSLIFFSKWGDEDGTIYDSEEGWNVRLTGKGWLVVGASTASCALIGALVGLGGPKEKRIYERDASIDVFPGFSYVGENQTIPSLTVRVVF